MKMNIKEFKSLIINSKIISLVLVVSIFSFFFYSSSHPVLAVLDINIGGYISFIRDYLLLSRAVVSLGLTALFVGSFYKKKSFNLEVLNWLIILVVSFALSWLFLVPFLDSNYWWLILLLGFVVGFLVYVLKKEQARKIIGILAGITSLLAAFFASYQGYLLNMSPPVFPSVLYADSFPNTLVWLSSILFVFFTAYLFSTGTFINRIFKRDDL